MRYFKKIKLFIFIVLNVFCMSAFAEGIVPTRAEGKVTSSGQIALSSRFKIDLPDELRQALLQGVPLYFDLSYDLVAPIYVSYKIKIQSIFATEKNVQYKLSFHPLTNQYRVSVGTFSTEYPTLDSALKAVGAIVGWKILDYGALSGYQQNSIIVNIRLALSVSKMPKPFQFSTLSNKNLNLDSDWQKIRVSMP